MFAFMPWTERAIHALLIAVILFNALVPIAAIAMPLMEENEVKESSTLVESVLGMKGLRGHFLTSSLRSSTLFQDNTATAAPTEVVTETPTPTPEPFDTLTTPPSTTPTAILEETPTAPPVLENTATPSPTLEATLIPSVTPTATETSTTPIAPSALSLEFSASPNQIKTADQVTFTLNIVNQGQSPVAVYGHSSRRVQLSCRAEPGFRVRHPNA